MKGKMTKLWAYVSIALVVASILFLFVYVFIRGAGTITWEFLSQPPLYSRGHSIGRNPRHSRCAVHSVLLREQTY